MDRLRIGVIGAGRIAAGSHLPCLARFPDVELLLCEVDAARRASVAGQFAIPESRTYADHRELLARERLDAAFVLTPPAVTYGVAKDTLAAGIPTLMEKPPGMATAETRDLRDTARARGTFGMVAVNRRFQPMLNEARRMVERDGPIATIVAEFYHYSMALYRQLGSSDQTLANIITPGAIHTIDLVRYLGGDVAVVHASKDAYFDKHPDSFTALIRFQGGANALLNYNLTSPVRIEKVSFHGRQASAFLVGLAESCVVHQGDVTFDLRNIRRYDPSSPEWSDRPYNPVINGWWDQARFFVDCVRDGREPAFPASNLEDAVKTMELIDLIGGQFDGVVEAAAARV
jgi:predicted dehydrogenase